MKHWMKKLIVICLTLYNLSLNTSLVQAQTLDELDSGLYKHYGNVNSIDEIENWDYLSTIHHDDQLVGIERSLYIDDLCYYVFMGAVDETGEGPEVEIYGMDLDVNRIIFHVPYIMYMGAEEWNIDPGILTNENKPIDQELAYDYIFAGLLDGIDKEAFLDEDFELFFDVAYPILDDMDNELSTGDRVLYGFLYNAMVVLTEVESDILEEGAALFVFTLDDFLELEGFLIENQAYIEFENRGLAAAVEAMMLEMYFAIDSYYFEDFDSDSITGQSSYLMMDKVGDEVEYEYLGSEEY